MIEPLQVLGRRSLTVPEMPAGRERGVEARDGGGHRAPPRSRSLHQGCPSGPGLGRAGREGERVALASRDQPIHRTQEAARRLVPGEVARPRLQVRPGAGDAAGTLDAGARWHRAQLADDHPERDRDGWEATTRARAAAPAGRRTVPGSPAVRTPRAAWRGLPQDRRSTTARTVRTPRRRPPASTRPPCPSRPARGRAHGRPQARARASRPRTPPHPPSPTAPRGSTDNTPASRSGMPRRSVEHQVASPRVPHQVGGLPTQPVQHGDDVGHRLGDRELALLRRRRKTALLKGRDLVAGSELRHGIVEVVVVHARTAMNRQHARSLAGDPPRELTCGRGNRERGSLP